VFVFWVCEEASRRKKRESAKSVTVDSLSVTHAELSELQDTRTRRGQTRTSLLHILVIVMIFLLSKEACGDYIFYLKQNMFRDHSEFIQQQFLVGSTDSSSDSFETSPDLGFGRSCYSSLHRNFLWQSQV